MDDVDRIVAGLSRAQRECIMAGSDVGGIAASRTSAAALVDKGVAIFFRGMRGSVLDWTPLGTAVRARLAEVRS